MTKMLQVRRVPDDVHTELKRRARAAGLTLSDYALHALERAVARPSIDEVLARSEERHAPHLLDVEVAAALRGWILTGKLDAEQASAAITDLRDLDIVRHDHALLLERALELRNAVSAYDAMYVALADLIGAELITSDAPLSRGAAAYCRIRLLGSTVSAGVTG